MLGKHVISSIRQIGMKTKQAGGGNTADLVAVTE